jgi:NADPH:quinone reductase-like Zn-dependent oxidoreductase
MKNWPSLIWNAPGRTWAAMLAAAPIATWLIAGAAMAWTVMTAWLVVFFKPHLGVDQAFWIIMGALGIVLVALISQTGQEISISVSRAGINANVGRDDVAPVAQVTEPEEDPAMFGGPRP